MAQRTPSFKLLADFGDRALWGTDWPHANLGVVPDDIYGFAA